MGHSGSLTKCLGCGGVTSSRRLGRVTQGFRSTCVGGSGTKKVTTVSGAIRFGRVSREAPDVPAGRVAFLQSGVCHCCNIGSGVLASALGSARFVSFCRGMVRPVDIRLSCRFAFGLLAPHRVNCKGHVSFITGLLRCTALRAERAVNNKVFSHKTLAVGRCERLVCCNPMRSKSRELMSLGCIGIKSRSLCRMKRRGRPPSSAKTGSERGQTVRTTTHTCVRVVGKNW